MITPSVPIKLPATAAAANLLRIDSQNPVQGVPVSQIMTYPYWPSFPGTDDGLIINFPNAVLSTGGGTQLWTGFVSIRASLAGMSAMSMALLQRLTQPPVPAIFAVVVEGSYTLGEFVAEVQVDRTSWVNIQF